MSGSQIVNGNVGIGTTNPQARLHVSGNIMVGADGGYNTISGPTTGGAIQIGSNSTTFDRNLHLGFVAANLSFSPILTLNAQTSNVGIGTTSPSDILDVQRNQNAITNFYFRNTDTTNNSSRAYLN